MAKHSSKPNILWRLGVVAGLGTAVAVSVDDGAWESFDDATGGTVSRDAVRSIAYGTLAVHVLESMSVYRSARSAGLDKPGKWARSTLLWGFPVLFRLRRAKKKLAAAPAADA